LDNQVNNQLRNQLYNQFGEMESNNRQLTLLDVNNQDSKKKSIKKESKKGSNHLWNVHIKFVEYESETKCDMAYKAWVKLFIRGFNGINKRE